jgi:hypothetical protein
MIEFAGKLPSPQCEILLALIAGSANRVPADAMAYRHRDAKFVLNVHGRWDERTDDERCIAWARAFFQATAPYAAAGAYVNFMTEEEAGWPQLTAPTMIAWPRSKSSTIQTICSI